MIVLSAKTILPAFSGVQGDGWKTIERLRIHLPIGHKLDARAMLHSIVERLPGFGFQVLQQVFRLLYIREAQPDFGRADGGRQAGAEADRVANMIGDLFYSRISHRAQRRGQCEPRKISYCPNAVEHHIAAGLARGRRLPVDVHGHYPCRPGGHTDTEFRRRGPGG